MFSTSKRYKSFHIILQWSVKPLEDVTAGLPGDYGKINGLLIADTQASTLIKKSEPLFPTVSRFEFLQSPFLASQSRISCAIFSFPLSRYIGWP